MGWAAPLVFCFVLAASHLIIPLHRLRSAASPPLYTDSRWVVDAGGRRVKLACVNWVAHMEPMVAEGLGKQPLAAISGQIAAMGFNCVRLTWALFMLTNDSLSSLTVVESLRRLGLAESAAGVEVNNPKLAHLSVVQAFQGLQEVVSSLARNDVMVVLDNQISKPEWCCSKFDGNGFFGDEFFDPGEWLRGLSLMAALFNGSSSVVAMSLRNELRGPRQNLTDWYRYMQIGAEAVHSANPDVLVILSGLDYDKDLSFLAEKPVELSFSGKLVFELHWYGFSDDGDWERGNPNEVCGSVVGNLTERGLFLLEQGHPLFLSEFGLDQRALSLADARFLSCLTAMAAELDLDWALWALQGSYYLREGTLAYDETYGILTWSWCEPRNSFFLPRISTLQSPLRGPGLSENSEFQMIFHPSTGQCILKNPKTNELELGSCADTEAWSFQGGSLAMEGTELHLLADGVGEPARVGPSGGCGGSIWRLISDSKMHIATTLANDGGTTVCLDAGAEAGGGGGVVTNLCKCLTKEELPCDPQSQWFKVVSSTRSLRWRRRPLASHGGASGRRTWIATD